MAVSPVTTSSNEPLTYVIKTDGREIPDSAEVTSVVIRSEMNRIPEAFVRLIDGDPATGEFTHTDAATFKPGAKIEISAGYGGTVATVFKGIVVGVRLRLGGHGSDGLEVSCRDEAFKLTLGRKSRVLTDVTDSDAISTVLGEAGLSLDVTATSNAHPTLVQYRLTDWDFVLARADASGLVVCVQNGKVTVRAPYSGSAAVLVVTYGEDLIGFDGEIDARNEFASVTASGWDIGTQAAVVGTAGPEGDGVGNLTPAALSAVGGSKTLAIEGAAARDSAHLDALAKARQGRSRLARLRARVSFQGSSLAEVGTMLELKHLGDRFSGSGLICGVTHNLENGEWLTEAELGLDPERPADRRGVAGGAGPGLQIGKVVKLNDDPNGQNMIQVQLPLVGAAPSEVWARLGGPYCTNGAGVMFLPEVGDEVIVGFFDTDPSFAVVLGSLHSATNAPPLPATETNYVKTILTPQKVKIEFDDEKKKLTLATPAGNTVVLDDDAKSVKLTDQSGNSVELASGGITLDSKGDVTIKASKKVSIDAGTDATVAGMNVTATAQTSFSASGNASAELKASGTLKVQGALVQIN